MVFLFNWEQGVVLAQSGVVVGKERSGAMDFCCTGGGAGPAGSHSTPAKALEQEYLGFIYHLDVIAFSHLLRAPGAGAPQHPAVTPISPGAHELEPPEGLTPLQSLFSSPVLGLGWKALCPVLPVLLRRAEERE